ncbi:hypothetical protein GVO57_10415 [Sphingomonas changnyeongensis]|uniref:CopC domain-containing protein n=1 Tax=Sphingomonas changnyeongensis TaxID=2698679 RepID=A0A7Z2S664_9SPHN|nr:copper resistance CopC family protein [Sphingomonas changnyeongensis]QHL91153.1 hypothetical protein GVO57_10415 [Sphingomonas changnyeongensis]
MKLRPAIALALALLVAPTAAVVAHTALKSSSPASGSVLTEAPPALTLTFLQPTRLTSLMLVNTAGEQRLGFKPGGSALSFTTAKPGLVRGRNEIRWRALSQDGHVVEGSIILVLRAPRP